MVEEHFVSPLHFLTRRIETAAGEVLSRWHVLLFYLLTVLRETVVVVIMKLSV